MSSELTIIGVASPADIRSITKIHEELNAALQRGSSVRLQLDSASDVDLTFVQLVESARRFAASAQKAIALAAPASGGLRSVLERGGFLKTPENRAFWLHEGEG